MPKLPVLPGNDIIKALSRIGDNFDHQTGSHITLVNLSGKKITVPNHRELGPGFDNFLTSLNRVSLILRLTYSPP